MATISPIPPFPALADRSAGTYNSKAYAFGTHMADLFPGEINTVVAEVNSNTHIVLSAKDETKHASAAAIASASFKGAWSALGGALAVPASTAHNGQIWLLMESVSDVTAHQPGVSSKWQLFNSWDVSDTRTTAKTLTAPQWLVCDGATYLQSSYAQLFAALGLLDAGQEGDAPWTVRLGTPKYFKDCVYSGQIFVALAGSNIATNYCYTSIDGITWTQRTLPSAAVWKAVTYGAGMFVALAEGSATAATSLDGITWAQRALPVSASWRAVTFGSGTFVAVAHVYNAPDAIAATSLDGITWTQRVLPAKSYWSAVAYGAGLFIAISQSNGDAATSTDGVTWTKRLLPTTSNWADIAFGAGLFVAVAGNTHNKIITSSDGITWAQHPLPAAYLLRAVTFGAGLFVAVGDGAVLTSLGGITWTPRDMPVAANWVAVAFGAGLFVVGDSYLYSDVCTMGRYKYDITTMFRVPTITAPSGMKTWIKA